MKDLLSYIRAAMNREDLTSLGRIVNVPTRGIGKVTYLKMIEGNENDLKGKVKEKVDGFYKLMDKISSAIVSKTPSEALKFVMKESGLEESYKKEGIDGEERIENVGELITLASRYDGMEKPEGLLKLIEDASLATDQDDLEKDNGGVKLMTVHASKGLEFDHVFVTGLEEGLFPHERMEQDNDHDDEEERRLFYVAITRAGKKLYLTHTSFRTIYGSQQVNIPSEFLNDIEEELLEYDGADRGGGVKEYLIDF